MNFSVKNALEKEGFQAIISNSKKEILDANIIILPGIGAFNEAMHRLKKLDLDNFLTDLILNGKNFLGICLGMQLLFDSSEEFNFCSGLGILKGKVMNLKKLIRKHNIIMQRLRHSITLHNTTKLY